MGVSIFCGGCGDTGVINKVTPGLRHACGSAQVGLVGIDPMPVHLAAASDHADNPEFRHAVETAREHIPIQENVVAPEYRSDFVIHHVPAIGPNGEHYSPGYRVFKDRPQEPGGLLPPANDRPGVPVAWVSHQDGSVRMASRTAKPQGPGTGWTKSMPDPAANWSSYPGPLPGPNPVHNPPVADNMICPVCEGAGYDIQDKTICRECGGSGEVTATTARPAVEQYDSHEGPPVGGARHAAVYPPSPWPRSTGNLDAAQLGVARQQQETRQQHRASGGRVRTAGRPSKTDPYGTAEYQNRNGGGYYQGRGAPSGPFSDENEDTWYPKADTQSPTVRVRQDRNYGQPPDRPYQLNEATCPECGHAPTELRKTPADRRGRQDAVWTCPRCGPLVNIDKNPQIDPYRPQETGYQGADRNALGKLSRMALLRGEQRSGKLLRIMATVQESNTLSLRESLQLARQTLTEYPEGRG